MFIKNISKKDISCVGAVYIVPMELGKHRLTCSYRYSVPTGLVKMIDELALHFYTTASFPIRLNQPQTLL